MTVLSLYPRLSRWETLCNGKNIRLLMTALTNVVRMTKLVSKATAIIPQRRVCHPACLLEGSDSPTLGLENVHRARGLNFLNSVQSTYVVWVLFVVFVCFYGCKICYIKKNHIAIKW